MHRWRPVVDESAQNSLAGSGQGSQLGGTTRTDGTSRIPLVNSSRIAPLSGDGITPRTSNRTSNDQTDYFRRPSMRSAMSHMSEGSSLPHSRGITRTETGRTETTEHTSGRDGRYGTGPTNSETHRTRTDTTGLSRNQSMKTNTTETNRTRTEATVSRNTSMSTTRTHNTVQTLSVSSFYWIH